VGLPALITLFGASASLAAIQFLRLQPRFVWVEGGGMTFYWQWLATLPLFGAAGAYLSQRAEGGSVTRLLAGLSPAIILLIVMSLNLPWGLVIDGFLLPVGGLRTGPDQLGSNSSHSSAAWCTTIFAITKGKSCNRNA
jgi:hypothetical protein